jgi:hypothetical protein
MLVRAFSVELASTVAFDYPTINALADHIIALKAKSPQQTTMHVAAFSSNESAPAKR